LIAAGVQGRSSLSFTVPILSSATISRLTSTLLKRQLGGV
jgi:hypothetical protein